MAYALDRCVMDTGRVKRALRACLACLVVWAAACTSWRGGTARVAPDADQLLAGTVLGSPSASSTPVANVEDVLAVSPEMRAFLDAHVDRKATDSLKLRQLIGAIIDSATFGLVYDNITRTAAETFHARHGNCLSFSSMFVAMARDVGLNVSFQEVDIPPDWTIDKDTYVLNQHVNVRVDLGREGLRLVDFNIGDFKSSYELRQISDARALAHYFNNIGVERMLAGDTAAAFVCFHRAIVVDNREFSQAWTNLGTLYLRNGHAPEAEGAYLQALVANPKDLVAMSDLSRLYDQEGDSERAAAYRKMVLHHRWLNPYYRYELARRAFLAQDYNEAVSHLKYAIRKRPKEDEFCFLLGLTYLRKGDESAARHWLDRAKELAATDAVKRRYSSKIDTLLRGR